MRIDHIDHFVLTVEDMQTTCDFYSRVLGMSVATFGQGRKALLFGHQKINLHEAGKEFEPKARVPTAGSADFCLITDTPSSRTLKLRVCQWLKAPRHATGATGAIRSVYLRDPDQNLVEVSNYI
jgi:catechol 2,3-dioxygenase-like lactoylglutathione lyase family enzyme